MALHCSPSSISEALAPVARLLAADGFRLSCELTSGRAHVSVVAGDDACGDCLVPPSTLLSIILDKLRAIAPDVEEGDVVLVTAAPSAGAIDELAKGRGRTPAESPGSRGLTGSRTTSRIYDNNSHS